MVIVVNLFSFSVISQKSVSAKGDKDFDMLFLNLKFIKPFKYLSMKNILLMYLSIYIVDPSRFEYFSHILIIRL